MIVADFLAQVKREGRVEGDTDFDAFIVDTLNELIIEAVMQERVPELRILEFPIDIPIDDEPVDLPADYLKMYRLRYENFATGKTWTLNDGTGIVEPAPPGFYRFPKYFSVVGQQILIRPIEEINEDDAFTLDYYSKPEVYLADEVDTEITPERLIPYLVRATLARLKVYHEKLQEGQFHSADANKAAQGFVEENAPQPEAPTEAQ